MSTIEDRIDFTLLSISKSTPITCALCNQKIGFMFGYAPNIFYCTHCQQMALSGLPGVREDLRNQIVHAGAK